jgi:hypothetical protein
MWYVHVGKEDKKVSKNFFVKTQEEFQNRNRPRPVTNESKTESDNIDQTMKNKENNPEKTKGSSCNIS